MKKVKLTIITIASLLLSACSNTQSPNGNNTENQKLSSSIDTLPNLNNNDYSNTTRFPISGKNISGENSFNKENNTKIESDNTQENTKNQPEINNSKSNKQLLNSYSSKVYTKTEDRQKNLRIVCEKISGVILKPNEEFSYNNTCGPYNKENGFGKATVFLGDGTEKEDYGGGVCQLSSTLYNAIKDLNVEITERHNHSKKVYYVPDGEDATVSYGNLDFKFKNLNNYSLLIEAKSSANSVDVYVYKI